MTDSFRSFDPAQVVIVVGSRALSGYADGTFVSISRDADSFSKYIGSDGSPARVHTNNFSGSFTVTLMQTSPDNDYLSALLAVAENSSVNGAGVFNVKVNDKNGTTTCIGYNCWIRKPPDVEFSREFSTREWVIDAAKLEMVVGGNLVENVNG